MTSQKKIRKDQKTQSFGHKMGIKKDEKNTLEKIKLEVGKKWVKKNNLNNFIKIERIKSFDELRQTIKTKLNGRDIEREPDFQKVLNEKVHSINEKEEEKNKEKEKKKEFKKPLKLSLDNLVEFTPEEVQENIKIFKGEKEYSAEELAEVAYQFIEGIRISKEYKERYDAEGEKAIYDFIYYFGSEALLVPWVIFAIQRLVEGMHILQYFERSSLGKEKEEYSRLLDKSKNELQIALTINRPGKGKPSDPMQYNKAFMREMNKLKIKYGSYSKAFEKKLTGINFPKSPGRKKIKFKEAKILAEKSKPILPTIDKLRYIQREPLSLWFKKLRDL